MSNLSEKNIVLANKIADRIKNLRIIYAGEKQTDFVEKFNVEKQEISRWESYVKRDQKTGKIIGRGITIYTIDKFCNLIGISIKDFFDDPIFQEFTK